MSVAASASTEDPTATTEGDGAAPPPQRPKAPLPRMGIIGSGWGATVHLPKFRDAGFPITALWTRNPDKAQALAAAHNIPSENTFSGDGTDGITSATGGAEFVSVAGPAHRRSKAVLTALKNGKHILCEKPIAVSVHEAKEISKRVTTVLGEIGNRQIAVVDFQLRCVPQLAELKQKITSGLLGNLNVNVAVQFRSLHNFAWMQPGVEANHRHYRQNGGGVWAAIGMHYSDLVRFLFDDEIQRVACEQRPVRGVKVVGRNVYVSGQNPGLPDDKQEASMVINSTKATVTFDFLTSKLTVCNVDEASGKREMKVLVTDEPRGNAWEETGTRGLAARLKEHFESEGAVSLEGVAKFADGLRGQQIWDALNKSAIQDGEWVEIS
eukprot:g13970.t1